MQVLSFGDVIDCIATNCSRIMIFLQKIRQTKSFIFKNEICDK